MPALVTDKGKTALPTFYGQVKQTATKSSSNLPVYSVLVLVGVAIVFILRNREHVKTGPVLSVVPSYDADISTITNITNTANLIAHPGVPAGGASTPVVWSPNSVGTN